MRQNLIRGLIGAIFGIATGGIGATAAHADGDVNVYSYRQPVLVVPLFAKFTEQTGIDVNVVYANRGLIERMVQEDANSPADLLLTTDIGLLSSAVEQNVAQSLDSPVLSTNIPSAYRDPDGRWFGLTTRARVVYAAKDRVAEGSITYEELADPKWRGRVCTRSGQHDYSIGLIASMIANLGEDKARDWLAGLKANLARKPTGNDRAQAKAIQSGECDIALANTYYLGAMLTNEKEPEQQDWAKAVRVIFPNTEGRGTHVNLSGMLLAKHAPNRDNAVKLMEWLTGTEAQRIYAEVNFEYPIRDDVPRSEMVQSWGDFKPDPIPLSDVAKFRKRASELVDEVGFDDGPAA